MNKIQKALDGASKIAIFSHVSPDADALCSAFAFKNIILNNFEYKYVDVFIDGAVGELYEPILRNEVLNPTPYSNYDLAIILDCPNIGRIGKYAELFQSIPMSINIDHHATNQKFGSINYVTEKVSSSCEFLYLIANMCKFDLNNTIAKELYQGIITDTNCFTSLSVTKLSHKILNELLGYKFNADAIKEYYFKNNSKAKTKLIAKSLNGIKYHDDGAIAIMKITYEDIQKSEATFEDTLGIIDSGTSINGVKVCALLIEKEPEKVYVSLRSKGEVSAEEIANHFNGGGSTTVAAFQYSGNIKDIEKDLVDFMKSEVKDISEDKDSIKLF